MKQVIFTGAATALVTPFDKNGDISWGEIERLVEFQIEGGIDAIVACGTTGEAATMTTEDHIKVIQFIIDRANCPWRLRRPGLTACCWSPLITTRPPKRV